jgi:hypothetical protein
MIDDCSQVTKYQVNSKLPSGQVAAVNSQMLLCLPEEGYPMKALDQRGLLSVK